MHPEASEFNDVEPPDEDPEVPTVPEQSSEAASQSLISLKTLEILQRMEARIDRWGANYYISLLCESHLGVSTYIFILTFSVYDMWDSWDGVSIAR